MRCNAVTFFSRFCHKNQSASLPIAHAWLSDHSRAKSTIVIAMNDKLFVYVLIIFIHQYW